MAAIGPVAVLICAFLPFCPESSRRLVYLRKVDEVAAIAKIFSDGIPLQVQQKVQHINM